MTSLLSDLSNRYKHGRMVCYSKTRVLSILFANSIFTVAMGNPSSEILGLITSTMFIGGVVGACFAVAQADRFGRRVGLQIGSLLGLVGSVMQSAAPNRNVFIGGRAILGCGLSFTTTSGPNLLLELSHPRLRGMMGAMVSIETIFSNYLHLRKDCLRRY